MGKTFYQFIGLGDHFWFSNLGVAHKMSGNKFFLLSIERSVFSLVVGFYWGQGGSRGVVRALLYLFSVTGSLIPPLLFVPPLHSF